MSEVGQLGNRAVGPNGWTSNESAANQCADINLLPDRPTARLPDSILAVVFDWGRTLWDSEAGALFPDALTVLDYLAPRYRLAIVSLATGPDHATRVAERRAAITTHGLARYFDPVIFTAEDKDRAYADALRDMSLLPAQVAIVDDRTRRGIRWGNQHSALTIWFRNGKFADELLDDDTDPPAQTITWLAELRGVL